MCDITLSSHCINNQFSFTHQVTVKKPRGKNSNIILFETAFSSDFAVFDNLWIAEVYRTNVISRFNRRSLHNIFLIGFFYFRIFVLLAIQNGHRPLVSNLIMLFIVSTVASRCLRGVINIDSLIDWLIDYVIWCSLLLLLHCLLHGCSTNCHGVVHTHDLLYNALDLL